MLPHASLPADYPLLDGATLPAIGFGLYKVDDADTLRVVPEALDAGYRLIDGAQFYGNERALGRAYAAAGRPAGVQVASKFWGDPVQSYEQVFADFAGTEADLDLGRPLDLYLSHWPRPSRGASVDVWRALIELRAAGRVRSIGVANFRAHEIERLIDETGVVPVLNQVESHPWLPQHELRAFHERHGIVTQAWSPLGRGRLLGDPVLGAIGERYGVTAAQVILRWHRQLGGAAVPKSVTPARLRQNLDLDGFALDDADMARIATLASGERTGTDPADRE